MDSFSNRLACRTQKAKSKKTKTARSRVFYKEYRPTLKERGTEDGGGGEVGDGGGGSRGGEGALLIRAFYTVKSEEVGDWARGQFSQCSLKTELSRIKRLVNRIKIH